MTTSRVLLKLIGRVSLLLGLLVGLCAAPGCRKPLLSPDDDRSQYDRYDEVRNQRAPQFVVDEYGRQRPNLRGRLLSKD
jgi:hypothetical protein